MEKYGEREVPVCLTTGRTGTANRESPSEKHVDIATNDHILLNSRPWKGTESKRGPCAVLAYARKKKKEQHTMFVEKIL